MNFTILRVYADTSVFGGVFDEGFEEASLAVFRQVREGRAVSIGDFPPGSN